MSLKHLIAAILAPVSLFILPAPFAAASMPSDSVTVERQSSPTNRVERESRGLRQLRPRMESDGLVTGNTKYFMIMYRPDSSIDYKILRVTPNMKGMERMPGTFSFPPDIHGRGR
jgi:hypothetical protein